MMFRLALAAAAVVAAAPAAAQEAPGEPLPEETEAQLGLANSVFSLSGEIGLMSDYRFRGVSRSGEDPALQAQLTLSHRSGFYAGGRATTLEGLDGFRLRAPGLGDTGDVQLDLYAGYGADLGGGWEMDAGALYYAFLGAAGPSDYVEPYASLSYLIGPVLATGGIKYAPSQDATGNEDMLYLFGEVEVSVPFRPWSFTAGVGHQDWGRFGNYWNWSLGVQHQLRIGGVPDAEVGLRYVDTDLGAGSADATLVGSISLRF